MKAIFALTISVLAISAVTSTAEAKKTTALDKFVVQSATDHRGLKRSYDEQQQLSRTTQFRQEDSATTVELGASIPEWGGTQIEAAQAR